MWKRICVFLLALSMSFLSSCAIDPSKPYSFRQSVDKISELCLMQQNEVYDDWDSRFSVIKELGPNQYADFCDELKSIKGQRFFNPPQTEFDQYVIRIVYQNGEIEYISRDNNAYFIPEKGLKYDTYWFSDKAGFNELILKYLGQGTVRNHCKTGDGSVS